MDPTRPCSSYLSLCCAASLLLPTSFFHPELAFSSRKLPLTTQPTLWPLLWIHLTDQLQVPPTRPARCSWAWKFRVGSDFDAVGPFTCLFTQVSSPNTWGPATLTPVLLHPWPKEPGLSPVCLVSGAPLFSRTFRFLVCENQGEVTWPWLPSRAALRTKRHRSPPSAGGHLALGCGICEPCARSEVPLPHLPRPPLSEAEGRTPGLG